MEGIQWILFIIKAYHSKTLVLYNITTKIDPISVSSRRLMQPNRHDLNVINSTIDLTANLFHNIVQCLSTAKNTLKLYSELKSSTSEDKKSHPLIW